MTARIINGKQIAATILEECRGIVAQLKKTDGKVPGLAAVLVGDDAASRIYVRNKIRTCQKIGMHSELREFPANITQAGLIEGIAKLNEDPRINGILVQIPVPPHICKESVMSSVHPDKDVDGLHPKSICALYSDTQKNFIPCTPKGCLFLLKQVHSNLTGLHAVIIGRSLLVGKPMAHLLLSENCSVTLLHSHSKEPAILASRADILISAVGVPGMITAEWVKPGATVIDVGINRDPRNPAAICGDADYPAVREIAGAITPVPGGVGPMTVAGLMQNCIRAFKLQHNKQNK